MYVSILLVFSIVLTSCGSTSFSTVTPASLDTGAIIVSVLDQDRRILSNDVVVRVTNSAQVDNNDNGGFRVVSCNPNQFIAAWAPGYEVGYVPCDGNSSSYAVQLKPLSARDNTNYSWAAATGICINCHARQIGDTYDEMNEWWKSGHAKVFDNRYLETMYLGVSLSGGASPSAQMMILDNNLVKPPPTINDRYYGPRFKLDYPQQPGNCAYCHVPAAVPSSQVNVDLSLLFPNPGGVNGEGVTCDVCHKVFDVTLDDNGFPFIDRPGVLSFKFLRPDSGIFMIGPFAYILTKDSNIPTDHPLACSSIFSRSEFCAACHYGKFGDTVIYNSYGEWRKSPFGDNPNETDYRTCQDCHMSHMKVEGVTPPSSERQACSKSGANFQNFDHNMMSYGMDESLGREIPLMVRGAALIGVGFRYEPNRKNSLDVIVNVKNIKAGHKFPTDSPLRHLILAVSAKDQLGTSLMQVGGERIPNWVGVGNAYMESIGINNYVGLPGKVFANLLVEEDNNISPTAAYWNETKQAFVSPENGTNSDNRLLPGISDESTYSFSIPDAGEINVTVTLIYRFAFSDLMVQKEWFDRPDIIVASVACNGMPTEPASMMCKNVELKVP